MSSIGTRPVRPLSSNFWRAQSD